MKNNASIKIGLVTVFTTLVIISLLTPLAIGYDISTSNDELSVEDYRYFDVYNISELTNFEYESEVPISSKEMNMFEIESTQNPSIETTGGPMDSPWSMFKYDFRNTGHSPYSTADNPGDNIWWLKLDAFIEGSGVIDNNGTIYFGSWDDNFYAVDIINRSVKWKYKTGGNIQSSPALDENGIIYVGTAYGYPSCLFAFYPDGALKWKYPTSNIFSSPTIADDNTIIFADTDNWYIKALYPNGTLKWAYKTGHVVYSSPAIGDDGTVYCGSHDTYLYALYPNNGTLKWKYKTGHWVRVSPCIADDGTIYVVSLDNYLHAVNPDGSYKWSTNVGAGTHPTIGHDGTIYAGYRTLHAVNPVDGSVKWMFDVGGTIRAGTPCISADGTIYVGTSDGGQLIAINPDGTEKWRKRIGVCEFAPIIDDNGTIYVGTSVNEQHDYGLYRGYTSTGFFYIFDELDPDAPYAPEINGPSQCKLKEYYNFTFKAKSPLNNDIYYWIDWGDNDFDGWYGPYDSNHEISLSHRWWDAGVHTIRCRAKDVDDRWGTWGYYEVLITKSKTSNNLFFMKFLERFPLLEQMLSLLIDGYSYEK